MFTGNSEPVFPTKKSHCFRYLRATISGEMEPVSPEIVVFFLVKAHRYLDSNLSN